MSNRQEQQPTSIRLSASMKRTLRIEAAIHDQSLSEEIICRLQRTLCEDERAAAAGQGVQSSPAAAGIETAALERGVPFTTGIGGAHDECPHG